MGFGSIASQFVDAEIVPEAELPEESPLDG
jgi:hypothetical protein